MGSVVRSLVTVHALDAGHLTLPEAAFVTPLDNPEARKTVPSLSFLIQHHDALTGRTTRIVFDLGIRRNLQDYALRIRDHAATRKPIAGDPDTITSLALGGLVADDVDAVMFSHLHWDHVGTPSDYPRSAYVVGPGAARLVCGEAEAGKTASGSHNHFERGMLDVARVIELPPTDGQPGSEAWRGDVAMTEKTHHLAGSILARPWEPLGPFAATMDLFGDGGVRVVSSPGHLGGHINLLCRVGPDRCIYLAGDACHDRRILAGDKDVATWVDEGGRVCCIHEDKEVALDTIRCIRKAMTGETELGPVEVVLAHDGEWAERARAEGRFFPGSM
ncbi:beta-lactamase-like protein [Plectosphaerella plurivora]|uniref:Beta-lactamase-like protein n=1 Tax=Plectosphaerella plurivora TaxID=936078 RepID=A0A9P9A8U3_9PEZI|nr:beta-lactamase-like protein [Plectosphaerella plurivora]